MKKILFLIVVVLQCQGYSQIFTRQDSLRGSITNERAWWNLIQYDLNVTVDPHERYISGSNMITYEVLNPAQVMQIDLQPPMKIDKALQNGKQLTVTSEGNAHFISLTKQQKKGKKNQVRIHFSGHPKTALRPPWDGGFAWEQDSNKNHFIATSNQGIGASIWWPNKDHAYDEPDEGMTLSVTTPKGLMGVSNGRLIGTDHNENTTTWEWQVRNPINNYGVNINIGDYVHFGETYEGENGTLDMDYYVLRENEVKARKQFKQVKGMMQAFEHWFGPYPFYEDSFKLVEVPYLGMEHQSSVTYGNQFQNGYLGTDLSGTGWGLKFDFIIIHEAGHEWFANNITHIDVADLWIHEGFTAYSENLYVEYHFGKKAGAEYVIGTRRLIQNDQPIIGVYNVHNEGSSDMYYKGANILHTIRQLLEDDKKWREILRGLNKDFYHQTVSSKQVEDYVSKHTGIDLTEFWEQYLRTTMIPTIEYKVQGTSLEFRYVNTIENFDMPVVILINDKEEWIFPKAEWSAKRFSEDITSVALKEDFYVRLEKF